MTLFYHTHTYTMYIHNVFLMSNINIFGILCRYNLLHYYFDDMINKTIEKVLLV